MGMIEPAFTNSGMMSSGAGELRAFSPVVVSPVQKSRQVPEGRYTGREKVPALAGGCQRSSIEAPPVDWKYSTFNGTFALAGRFTVTVFTTARELGLVVTARAGQL